MRRLAETHEANVPHLPSRDECSGVRALVFHRFAVEEGKRKAESVDRKAESGERVFRTLARS